MEYMCKHWKRCMHHFTNDLQNTYDRWAIGEDYEKSCRYHESVRVLMLRLERTKLITWIQSDSWS